MIILNKFKVLNDDTLITIFENGSVDKFKHYLHHGLVILFSKDGSKIYTKLFMINNTIAINGILTQLFDHYLTENAYLFDRFFQRLIEIYKDIEKTLFTWRMIYILLTNGFSKRNWVFDHEKYYFSHSLIAILNNCEVSTCVEILEDLNKRKKSLHGHTYTLLYDYNETSSPENKLHMNYRIQAIVNRKDYQTIIKIYGKEIFLFVYVTTPLDLVIENTFNHNMDAVSLLFNQPNLRAFKLVAKKLEQIIIGQDNKHIIKICDGYILPEYYKKIFEQINIVNSSGIIEGIQQTYKFAIINENVKVLKFVFHFLKYFKIDLNSENIVFTIENKMERPRILMLISYDIGYCQDCFKIAIKKSAKDQIYIHNMFAKRLSNMIKYIQPFIGGDNYDYTGIIKLINLYLPLENYIT